MIFTQYMGVGDGDLTVVYLESGTKWWSRGSRGRDGGQVGVNGEMAVKLETITRRRSSWRQRRDCGQAEVEGETVVKLELRTRRWSSCSRWCDGSQAGIENATMVKLESRTWNQNNATVWRSNNNTNHYDLRAVDVWALFSMHQCTQQHTWNTCQTPRARRVSTAACIGR